MELYTIGRVIWENFRINIYVDQKNDVSPYINDDSTFKLMVVQSGELYLQVGDEKKTVIAPAIVLLSNEDTLQVTSIDKLSTLTVYFKPTVIYDKFTYDNIYTIDYDNMFGTTIYQDYKLIAPFFPSKSLIHRIYNLKPTALVTIQNLINCMKKQLMSQQDCFWPCRSRSYFMELMYFITYSCIEIYDRDKEEVYTEPAVSEIMEYLHEHIEDEISLKDLTEKFLINRNQLNDMFKKRTSMTCLSWLMSIRMDLAKLMLAQTTLPIGEIAGRVGILDTNYFTKVFRKYVNTTPTRYREELAQ